MTSLQITKETAYMFWLQRDASMADILEKIKAKFGADCDMERIGIELHFEKTSGCGCHSEPCDFEPFLEIRHEDLANHFSDIRRGLQAFFTEDGTKITESDYEDIRDTAKQLFHERGLGDLSFELVIEHGRIVLY